MLPHRGGTKNEANEGGGLEVYGGTFREDKGKVCYGRLALSLTIHDPGGVQEDAGKYGEEI